MSHAYDFQQQLAAGQEGERRLDSFFAAWYAIHSATPTQQRQGIDRIFSTRGNTTILHVEYKTDWRASSTGNAFVETISVDTANKPGWIHTSKAHWLAYFLPDDDLVYWLAMQQLRTTYHTSWVKYCPERAIPNQGYHTHGCSCH